MGNYYVDDDGQGVMGQGGKLGESWDGAEEIVDELNALSDIASEAQSLRATIDTLTRELAAATAQVAERDAVLGMLADCNPGCFPNDGDAKVGARVMWAVQNGFEPGDDSAQDDGSWWTGVWTMRTGTINARVDYAIATGKGHWRLYARKAKGAKMTISQERKFDDSDRDVAMAAFTAARAAGGGE